MPLTITFGAASARGFGLFSAPAALDPNFEYVTMLLPGNGTNGGQNNTFLDSSTNNFTITRNGNTTQGTFSPYGSNWSNYFDGTGDYLSAASNAAFSVGTGDFTFEMFINPSNWTATVVPIFVVADTGGLYIGKNSSNFVIRAYAVADQLQYGTLPTVNQWTHVVGVRSGTTLSLYFNGTRVATTTNSYNFAQAAAYIAYDSLADIYTGYVSNLRLVKGTAVYDPTQTTLTVPTAPLTAISGTSLLTCADNRFIDDSTNNFTITVNGNTSVQRFSPFSPTASYATATIGGSGYFDGSGDYLSVADNAAFELGSGDFTLEGFVNFSALPASNAHQATFFSKWGGASTRSYQFYLYNNSGTYQLYLTYSTNGTTSTDVGVNWTPVVGSWYHIACVRNGSDLLFFVNGTQQGATQSISGTLSDQSTPLLIGSFNNTANAYMNGYISNARLVKGTAVYTSSFTIPTSPLTAISGTSLLCSFTNASIIDNAMMNDLETVGNAQISTSVSKFGGGSMAFDGTGDYLVSNAASTDLYAFGTGDFTVEFWMYANTVAPGLQIIYDQRPGVVTATAPTIYLSTSQLRYYFDGADRITGSTLSINIWYHIALCRASGSTKLFVNGTQAGSTYTDSNTYTNGALRPVIATDGSSVNTNSFNGYIDDLRITKGVARYTSNFTAPTAAFPTF